MYLCDCFDDDDPIQNEISDSRVFYDIIEWFFPLKILLSMEYEKEDDRIFTEEEQEVYDYLRAIANFYLKETEKYEKILDDYKNDQELTSKQKLKVLNTSDNKEKSNKKES